MEEVRGVEGNAAAISVGMSVMSRETALFIMSGYNVCAVHLHAFDFAATKL